MLSKNKETYSLSIDKIEYVLDRTYKIDVSVFNNKSDIFHSYTFEIRKDVMSHSVDCELEKCFNLYRDNEDCENFESYDSEMFRKWTSAKLIDELCFKLISNEILELYKSKEFEIDD